MAFDTISADEAAERAARGELVLVDIRRPDEWAATGIPEPAATATLEDPGFVAAVTAAAGGDLARPVALICRSGARSARGAALLAERGFSRLSHVGEGMAGSAAGPGWLARGLPVRPG
jgi:rhodanese-related sulfurtransferase